MQKKCFFVESKVPFNVFGNSSLSQDKFIKFDTPLFVEKLKLRTNYPGSSFEEDIVLKKLIKTRKLPCPIETTDGACKSLVD